MKKVILILLLLVIGAVLAFFIISSDDQKNKLTLTNDLSSNSTMKIVCEPAIPECPNSIEKGKKASYQNVVKLEFYVGSWYQYSQYDLYPPESGRFELSLKSVIAGIVPKGFHMRCYSGEFNKRTVELDCRTKNPL